MADSVFITELIVDGSQLESGVARSITSLNTIVDASNRAAESVNRLGETLDRVGRISESSRAGAAAQQAQSAAARETATSAAQAEAAMIRQTTAAGGSVGVMAQLSRSLREVSTSMDLIRSGTNIGSIGGPQAAGDLAQLRERFQQLTQAILQLREGASVAEVMERFPRAFATAAQSMQTFRSVAQEMVTSFAELEATWARAQSLLDGLRAKYEPARASAIQMVNALSQLNTVQREGFISQQEYLELQARIVRSHDLGAQAAQRAAEAQAKLNAEARTASQAQLGQTTYNTAAGVRLPGAQLGADGFPVPTAREAGAVFQEHFDLADSAQKVRAQIDPAADAFAKYNAQVAQYQTLLSTTDPRTKQSYLSQEEYNKAVSRAAYEHQGAVQSLHTMGTAIDSTNEKVKESTRQTLLNRNGQQELRAAGVNAFQALAAGMNPLFVAQMEGAQVVGAVIQGTKITLAQVVTTLGPIVALAAGVAAIAIHAVNAAADLRSFNLQLGTIALTAGGPTAAGLKSLQDHLRDTGSSAADAHKMISTVIQAVPQGLNPNAGNTIIPLARNIAAGRGTEAPEETTKLTAALTGGVDAMIKYGFELNALSAPQAVMMRDLNEQGRAADAMRIGIAALSAIYSGAFDRSLTDTQKILLELKKVWNDTLDDLTKSGFFQWLIDQLKGVVDGVRSTIDEFNRLKNLIPQEIRDMVVPVKPGGLFGPAPVGPTGLTGPDRFDTHGLDTNSEELKRLSTVLSEGSKALDTGFGVRATSTTGGQHVSGSLHYSGEAIDVQIIGPQGPIPNRGADSTGQYTALAIAAYQANQKMFPGTEFGWGNVFGVTPGSDVADIMHFQARRAQGSLGTPIDQLAAARATMLSTNTSTSANAADAARATTAPDVLAAQQKLIDTTNAQRKSVADIAEEDRKKLLVDKEVGAANRLAAADLEALHKANELGLQDDLRATFLKDKHADAVARIANENRIAADSARLESEGTIKSAEAYRVNTVEGLKAAAMTQAVAQARSGVISVQQAYNQLLTDAATKAIASSAAQAAALNPIIEGNARLAEAAKIGGGALRDAEIHNEAVARSQDAVNRALATGNAALIEHAQRTQDDNEKQLLTNETLKQTTAARTEINKSAEQVSAVKLETALQGLPPEQITAQLSLLRARQKLQDELSHATPEVKQDYLDQATALAKSNIELAEAQRQAQRLNDAMRSVGQEIDSSLTQRLNDFFDGKKAQTWGETMRAILKSLVVQITEFAFIKPLIGTALAALGFGAAAQGFGSFGGLFGGGGGSGVGDNTTVGGAPAGGSGTGNLLQVAGQAKSLFDSTSMPGFLPDWLGGGSGGGNLFGAGGLGHSLGFATTMPAGDAITAGFGPLAANAQGNVLVPGSLFGSTSLGSFLGGAGAGFGAGSLLNSLVGGHSVGGTFGSGAGSLTGALIGSIFPGVGTLLGGLLGGAGGGLLGGMFGPAKSTLASGALIDLATGKVGDFSSSGNQQNDQQAKQISKSIGDFSAQLQKLTGGTVDGSISVAATTKGIETHYSGSLGKIDAKFADAESAINGLELALAQNVSGVSDTLKTVLSHITDPSQIQSAVTFAAAYDGLKKAVDSAFSSIAADTHKVGEFENALVGLNKQFQDLADQTKQFGLSLDPINAGLTEANRRIQADFGTALDQAINGASGNDFVNQLTKVGQDFGINTRDAIAIGLGGDATTTDKIAQVERMQALAVLGGLTVDQLQVVVDKMGQTNPELAAMAQTLITTGLAAKGAGDALKNLQGGVKSLEDLAISLKTGQLSGLTPAAATNTATSAYQAQLAAVQKAGTNVTGDQLTDLAALGQKAVEASRTAYGEGPQTADLRRGILANLDAITGITGPSARATQNPALNALGTSSAVATAQAAAALAASAGATSKLLPGFAGGTGYTPPGAILVGENGPELMIQQGGAAVIPISAHTAYQWRGPSYAAGTGDMGGLLMAVVGELAALRRQTLGGQKQAAQDAGKQIHHQADIASKISTAPPPARQRLA